MTVRDTLTSNDITYCGGGGGVQGTSPPPLAVITCTYLICILPDSLGCSYFHVHYSVCRMYLYFVSPPPHKK